MHDVFDDSNSSIVFGQVHIREILTVITRATVRVQRNILPNYLPNRADDVLLLADTKLFRIKPLTDNTDLRPDSTVVITSIARSRVDVDKIMNHVPEVKYCTA